MSGDVETPAKPPSRLRTCTKLGLGGCALLFGCVVVWLFANVLYYPLWSRLATLDAQVELVAASTDEQLLKEARLVLRDRLKGRGVPSRIRVVGEGRLLVEVPRADLEAVRPLLVRRHQLRMLLAARLEGEQAKRVREQIVRDKAANRYDAGASGYDLVPVHSGTTVEGPSPVLVETRVGVGGADFKEFYAARDARGRSCIGFTMTAVGRKRLHELTSNNVNRKLAIVLNGRVRSLPIIRGAIGKRGIIEGGDAGWKEAELTALLLLLRAGDLPVKLSFAPGSR